ncbi:unnamed protein product [Withania somnifera]
MNSRGTSAQFWQWNSPIPYFYCGLAVIVVIIAFALIFLIFSRQNSTVHLVYADEEIKKRHQMYFLDPEPKIVVVFAGNDEPLYIAKPLTYSPSAALKV